MRIRRDVKGHFRKAKIILIHMWWNLLCEAEFSLSNINKMTFSIESNAEFFTAKRTRNPTHDDGSAVGIDRLL
jgi:hypothetical protein